MFRQMRRFKQQVSETECIRVLQDGKRAVLAVNGENGYPYALPLNYYYDVVENIIYFHGAKEGQKADAMRKDPHVCFTVWDDGYHEVGHWEWTLTSVVVYGMAEWISDRKKTEEKCRKIAEKYYPSTEDIDAEIAAAIDRVQLFAIHVDHVTGKLVNEK